MSSQISEEQYIRLKYKQISEDIIFEQGLRVQMRDGVSLSVNVFRPKSEGRYPVIMAVSPYGKDNFNQMEGFRYVPGMHLGEVCISDHTAFEAPDPDFWVSKGYVVVQGDVRGQGESDGDTGPFHKQDRDDYYDLIEWAASREWSTGKVGLNGVSYLCVSQWGVAALAPPSLKAIVPWEGWNDFYRRFYKGGIPETTFMQWLWDEWIKAAHNPNSGFTEPDYVENAWKHPLLDEYWESFKIDLEKIEVPALVCASFSDQGLHTRDTFEGFKKISSKEKWLITHREPKWQSYYSDESLEIQRKFLDYYLKGEGDGLAEKSKVSIVASKNRTEQEVIYRDTWPPKDTSYHELYLATEPKSLLTEAQTVESICSYDSSEEEGVSFDYTFESRTIVAGNAKAHLWVSAETADDIDLFIGIDKINSHGERVPFYGFGGVNPNDVIARGWLRVSHRELDEVSSTTAQPIQKHKELSKLKPSEVVAVEVELLPSATIFEPGDTLRLIIKGVTIKPDAPLLGYAQTVNKGLTNIHIGGKHNSFLMIPVLEN